MDLAGEPTYGNLHSATAAEMANQLRAAADVVDELSRCDKVETRLLLWRRLAAHMAEFDALIPEGFPR